MSLGKGARAAGARAPAVQGMLTGWLSSRAPRYWYVRWSMFCWMNRTDPSAKQKLAPPVWFDLNPQVTCQFQRQWAGSTPSDAQLELQSLHPGPTFFPSIG